MSLKYTYIHPNAYLVDMVDTKGSLTFHVEISVSLQLVEFANDHLASKDKHLSA